MKNLLKILREERKEAYDHSRRVGDYAFFLAITLGKDEKTAEDWQIAGYLHDIGKLTIPAEILNAPRRLTAEERAVVNNHSRNGADILSKYAWAKQEYIDAANYHHQHFNAEAFAAKGAADEGMQSRLQPRQICRYLMQKLDHPEQLAAMKDKMKALATPDAAAKVADVLESLVPQE